MTRRAGKKCLHHLPRAQYARASTRNKTMLRPPTTRSILIPDEHKYRYTYPHLSGFASEILNSLLLFLEAHWPTTIPNSISARELCTDCGLIKVLSNASSRAPNSWGSRVLSVQVGSFRKCRKPISISCHDFFPTPRGDCRMLQAFTAGLTSANRRDEDPAPAKATLGAVPSLHVLDGRRP